VKKWANELDRSFSKEEVQVSEKHMKKMLIIPEPKGNGNQNHTKILSTPIRIATIPTAP
jgi:hypothetical protein